MFFLYYESFIGLFTDGMGQNECLEIDVGVVEGVAVNNLELEGAGEGGGEDEGGGSSGNHDGIDYIIVLIHQLQHTAVAGRLERQHIIVNIYGRCDDGGFGVVAIRRCGSDDPERNGFSNIS